MRIADEISKLLLLAYLPLGIASVLLIAAATVAAWKQQRR